MLAGTKMQKRGAETNLLLCRLARAIYPGSLKDSRFSMDSLMEKAIAEAPPHKKRMVTGIVKVFKCIGLKKPVPRAIPKSYKKAAYDLMNWAEASR